MDPVALSAAQAGEVLGVSEWTIRRLVKDGHLRKVPYLGDRVLIARVELERFANQGLTVEVAS